MSIKEMIKMREDFDCEECGGRIEHTTKESYCVKCGLVTDDSPVDDNDTVIDESGRKVSTRTGPPLKPWDKIMSMI